MAKLDALDKLAGVSYELAQEHEDKPFTVHHVTGPGYSTMVRVTDTGAGFGQEDRDLLAALADKKLHLKRVEALAAPDEQKPPDPPPSLEERIGAALDGLDAKKATVADVIAAVKQALTA